MNTHPVPPDPRHRRRLADQIANQLYTARLLGGAVRFIQRHPAHLHLRPPLYDIVTTAAQVAAGGDPDLVRIAHTSSGALAVIRLHGPAWSLILSSGRPLPDWLLAVHDDYPLHLLPPRPARPGHLHAFDLRADTSAHTALIRMCQRIHATVPGPL